jgi:two-component system, sensor histidine kinase and response regulator
MEPSVTSRPLALQDRRILAADDDPSLRLLENILRGEGCTLAGARSAAEVHEIYATFRPDLVLLAATLPGLDGFATCRQLRNTHGDTCAPIIFTAAGNDQDAAVDQLDAGGADYLAKPFRPKEVLARVRVHLRNRILSDQLTQSNAAKNRFLGMAAHDLRGPLGAIRGCAEFLREGEGGALSPDQLEMIEMISTTSHQALELVNQLLDVATIDSGELKLVFAPCSLFDLLRDSAALASMEAAKKKTRVVFDAPGAGPGLVLDAAKMKQVVDNLLSNAVKYSPPGSTVTVLVRPDVAGGTCAICVRDQGTGIPEKERAKLFKDFGRLSVRPTGGESSTGLGLVICRKIVEAHRGTITAENLPTRGCEFRVTLPADPNPA